MDLNPFSPVTKIPLFTHGGQVSSRCSVVLDPEGLNEEVGVVSQDYALVPNQRVSEVAQEVLASSNLELEEGKTLFNGKRFKQTWILPEITAEAAPGDVIRITVDAFNSYNGSRTFGLAFNAQRLVCSNGMVVDFLLGGFQFRHYGKRDFDAELQQAGEAVLGLSEKVAKLGPILQRMFSAPIDRERLQEIYSELPLGQSQIAQSFLQIEQDSEWGVYNAITDVLTRQETFRAEDLNRQVSHFFMKEAA